MQNAILIPGRPDKDEYYDLSRPTNSNDHWFPWLSKQLMQHDIFTVALEVPKPYQPRYDIWKHEFERFDTNPGTILVGHSCGGGFLLRYLSEHKSLQVGKVFLIAPWMNPDNNPASDTADFFDFVLDPGLVARTKGVTVFVSQDDDMSVRDTVTTIRGNIDNVLVREFTNKGHFTLGSLGDAAFPELAKAILS